MSRFDVKQVNETWKIERTESGRKKAWGTENGRKVAVWVSDIKDEDGLYPIRGRYLIPLPDVTLVDGKLDSVQTLWVTRGQYKEIMRVAKVPIKKAGLEDVLHGLAKLFDKFVVKIASKIGPENIMNEALGLLFDQVMEKVMDKDFIIEKLGEIEF